MSQKRFKKAQDKALPWEAHYLTPTIPEDGAYDVDDLKRGWEDLKADKTPLGLIISLMKKTAGASHIPTERKYYNTLVVVEGFKTEF